MSTAYHLTKKQRETLDAIYTLSDQLARQPTLDEIAHALGLKTKSNIHEHVKALIRVGVLLPSIGKRAFELPQQSRNSEPSLKLLGKIAAGKPIKAIPDQQEIDPNALLVGPNRYALKVKGDSMIDIGIMDGDYIVIQAQDNANNGDVVVALVNGEEATLKRIYREDQYIELRPENRNLQPQRYPADCVQIQGKMVGLFRQWQ